MSLLDILLENSVKGDAFTPETEISEHYQHWMSEKDLRRCLSCQTLHGKIWEKEEQPIPSPPLHANCRCMVVAMESIKAGTATRNGTDGADWTLQYEGTLPDYYIAIEDIYKLGWKRGRIPQDYAPGKMIAGGVYQNRDGHLPQKEGRTWQEADINYRDGPRNSQRIVWSNDGLLFATYDHYQTFYEIV